ncbi:MAG TPA: hypothetical protein VGO87_00760 [Acidimicrobiia bacterium]|jgi:hypothetical protein
MKRYLVLVPPDGGDESLFEQLGRLATREPSRFHVVVPRRPGDGTAGATTAEERLRGVIGAFVARRLAADGEVGQASVVGSVARAAERTHYDALVVSVPGTRGLDALDLDVARRLHQIDIPELLLLTSCGPRAGDDA